MANYSWLYRRYATRATPWERYAQVSGASVMQEFDAESQNRTPPLGRALDVGCGRGTYTAQLAHRGWDVTGVDAAPEDIEAAQQGAEPGVRYVLGDATNLEVLNLGKFELFVDIGCFQGLKAQQRLDMAASISALAQPGAIMLMLAFGPSSWSFVAEGVSASQVEEAFAAWQIQGTWPAPTAGLGWPMNRTAPSWYRLQAPTSN